MTRLLILLLAVLLTSPLALAAGGSAGSGSGGSGQASDPLGFVTSGFDELNNLIDQYCSTVNRVGNVGVGGYTINDAAQAAGISVSDMTFMCGYGSLTDKAKAYTQNLIGGARDKAENTGHKILDGFFQQIGNATGLGPAAHNAHSAVDNLQNQVDQAYQKFQDGVTTSVQDYASKLTDFSNTSHSNIDQAVTTSNNAIGASADNPQTPQDKALAANPDVVLKKEDLNTQAGQVAKNLSDSQAAAAASSMSASKFLQNNSYKDVIAHVIKPDTSVNVGGGSGGGGGGIPGAGGGGVSIPGTGGTPGTAAQLAKNASKAPSTREAINVLSKGFSDYMQQDAVLSGNVIEGLRALVQQESITNWQLKTQADAEYQKQLDKIKQEDQQLTAAMQQRAAKSEHQKQEVVQALDQLTNVFGDTSSLTTYQDMMQQVGNGQ